MRRLREAGEGERAGRPAYLEIFCASATVFILVFATFNAWLIYQHAGALGWVPIGIDFAICREYAAGWLAGQPYYPANQLAGPYLPAGGLSLYPPTFLYLIVPFTILPAVLWWVVPLGVIAYVVRRHRPAPWAWPLLALIVWFPRTQEIVTYGNPTMWAAAAVSAGTVWRWPAAFVLLKASLVPFALIGITRRAWWITAGVLVLLSLPFGEMWLDFLKVVTGMQTQLWRYSLVDIPLVGIGLIAWAASTTRGASSRVGGWSAPQTRPVTQ